MQNKIYIILSIIIITILLNSCDEGKIVDGTIPYEKKLVVNCLISEGEYEPKITITKTLPADYNWDFNTSGIPIQALINDASGYISDGINKYELVFDRASKYHFKDFTPLTNRNYKLYITAEKMTINASTSIPKKATQDTVYIEEMERIDNDYNYGEPYYKIKFNIEFFTENNCMAKYLIEQEIDFKEGNLFLMIANEGISIENENTAVSRFISGKLYENDIVDIINNPNSIVLKISLYHEQYIKYYRTRYNGEEGGGIFSSSGNNIYSNIYGDGIGYFYGMNKIELKINYLNEQIKNRYEELQI